MTVDESRACIYCGASTASVKRGEHVIPAALGGAITTKSVCNDCNNLFSDCDRELSSRSPLSFVASQVLGQPIWRIWDVDRNDRNLLLEAGPEWNGNSLESVVVCPQIIFESGRLQIRGDLESINWFGRDNFVAVLVKSVRLAYHQYRSGKGSLFFEQVNDWEIDEDNRFPSRVFSPTPIEKLGSRLLRGKVPSFTLRYRTPLDKRLALNYLDIWNSELKFERYGATSGSYLSEAGYSYDQLKVLRCLLKIAVNLLSTCCSLTRVDSNNFRSVIRFVKGELPISSKIFVNNGFVYVSDIMPISASKNSHSFRLQYFNGQWRVYSSYFGGRMGSVVQFPGPCWEDWKSFDIVAPLKSRNWQMAPCSILQPLVVRVEWRDPSKMMSSMKLHSNRTKLSRRRK